MEGKYFFNNKDITMNLCIQILILSRKGSIFLSRKLLELFTILRHIRLCRILKIRFGRSQQDISQTGSMKNKNRRNYRQMYNFSISKIFSKIERSRKP